MSKLTPGRPRLICRWTRFRAALANDSSCRERQHCATCADCRAYFAAMNQFESSLRRDAVAAGGRAPATMETRIMNAVQRAERPNRRPQRSFGLALAGLAAVAMAAVVMVRIQPSGHVDVRGEAASIQDVLVVAQQLPDQIATLRPSAMKLLTDNSLQTEIASVQSDARSALDFLALNFLPATPKETAPPQT